MANTLHPTPGRIVLYRTDGRNGLVYDLPAVITVTQDSHPGNYPGGEQNPLPIPRTAEKGEVHLTVLSPGGFGTVVDDVYPPEGSKDFIGARDFTPGSGTYVEHSVRHCADYDNPEPRSWRWPQLV